MHAESTALPVELVPSQNGILFVSGFATSLRVERGHLIVRTGAGRNISEGRFAKVERPRLRRLVVFGKGGLATFEALAWLHAVGCSFVQLSRDGTVIVSSGEIAAGQPALRRAQALAMGTKVGLSLTRHVLREKLDGQREIVERWFDDKPTASLIDRSRDGLSEITNQRQAMALEARAAIAYWAVWSEEPVSFAHADVAKVPERWRFVGERHSMLTNSPRLATSPAGAITNYVYALAEFACRLAMQSHGLDPDLGWLHRDTSYRSSGALDLMECVRPTADQLVIQALRDRTFAKREFVEMPTGQVRLAPSLAKLFASSALPALERRSFDAANSVTKIIAASASSRVRTRQGPQHKKARVRSLPTPRTTRIALGCRNCGVVIEGRERMYCDECLPAYEEQRTRELAAAGKTTLAAMRSSVDDPARSPEALAKLAEASRTRMRAIRAWEREHGKAIDRRKYLEEILPVIQALTVPALMAATGLSQHYCWQVRTGRKRLHPMHWDAVLSMSPPHDSPLTKAGLKNAIQRDAKSAVKALRGYSFGRPPGRESGRAHPTSHAP